MVDQVRVKGGALLGALVSGALAAATLTGAPTANATCASFFGIGNSAQCTSNLTSVAIAIGINAQAHADGLFGAAFAAGNNSQAHTYAPLSFFPRSVLNLAITVGDNSQSNADGLFSAAIGSGSNVTANTGGRASRISQLAWETRAAPP